MATYVLVTQKPRGFPENQPLGPRPAGGDQPPSSAAKAKKKAAAAAAAVNDENKPLTPYQREAMRKLRRHFQTVQHSPLRYQSIEVSRHRERVRQRYPSSEGKVVKYPSYITQLGVPEYVPRRAAAPPRPAPAPPARTIGALYEEITEVNEQKEMNKLANVHRPGFVPARPSTASGDRRARAAENLAVTVEPRGEPSHLVLPGVGPTQVPAGLRVGPGAERRARPSTAPASRPAPAGPKKKAAVPGLGRLAAGPGKPKPARNGTARSTSRGRGATARSVVSLSARSVSLTTQRTGRSTRRSTARGHGEGELQITEDDGTYLGGVKRGRKHGYGVYRWTSGKWGGDKYEGQFERGARHGHGLYTYANGNQYNGEWERGRRQGRGRFTWFTGDWYEGSWLGDVMCGFGKKVWPSGDVYEGQWMDGRRHGRGTYVYKSTGDVYDGEYLNNSKNGRGVLTFANGDRFEGLYKDDMKDGEGRLYRRADGRVFTEIWKENELLEQIRE